MIEEKVPKVIAVRIHSGLLAQAGGPEELEGLQGAQGSLTLGHRHRAAGHCKWKKGYSVLHGVASEWQLYPFRDWADMLNDLSMAAVLKL